jgi:hypothetical protein
MGAVTIGSVAYYNSRVTGSATTFPQSLNRQTYAVAPYFMWEARRPDPAYRHDVMRRYYTEAEPGFQKADQQDFLDGWFVSAADRLGRVWAFYLGTALSIPLLFLPFAARDRRIRFWIWSWPLLLFGLALARFTQPHYVAPMAAGIFVILFQCVRHLRHWERGRQTGLWVVRLIALAAVVTFARKAIAGDDGVGYKWRFDRAELLHRLEQMPGKQLVIVRYAPDHFLEQEWVYNRADIDQSIVVWAREMSNAADNVDLQAYFHDRACWILEPDVDQRKLAPCMPLVLP